MDKAGVAQLAEQEFCKFQVAGSIPAAGPNLANKQRYDIFYLCNIAAGLLKQAGFEFRYCSLKSEACYYGWPGHTELLRIGGHRHTGPRRGKSTNVVSKLTFRADAPDGTSMKISLVKVEVQVAQAIGFYFMRLKQ